MNNPYRGEIWLVDLDPTRGHEQRGRRPALVVSADELNTGPADIVAIAPLTTKSRKMPLHVEIEPPEGGVRLKSYVMCEQIRSIDKKRLLTRLGEVSTQTMSEVAERLSFLLDL